MIQTHAERQPRKREDTSAEDIVEPKKLDVQTGDIDAILDEIDSVLEENAEEFVMGYVQQGGQ